MSPHDQVTTFRGALREQGPALPSAAPLPDQAETSRVAIAFIAGLSTALWAAVVCVVA